MYFRRYARGYLVFDILTSLPYDRITLPWRMVPGADDSFQITFVNLIPLLKLSRYLTFRSYVRQTFLVNLFSINCRICIYENKNISTIQLMQNMFNF